MQSTWIQSRPFDLIFFIFSLLLGPLLYALYVFHAQGSWRALSQDQVMIFYVLFTAIFDGPHIFQTFYRTHFDKIEFARMPKFHFLAPIVCVCISLLYEWKDASEYFVTALAFYGGWHITKQNIGFSKIYSRLNGESAYHLKIRERCIYSVFAFFILNEKSSLPNVVSIPPLLTLGAGVLALIYIALNVWQDFKQKSVGPSSLFLYLTSFYFLGLSFAQVPALVITALATVGHNVQYQAWMWLFHKRQPQRSTRNFAFWFFGTLALGVLMFVPLAPQLENFFGEREWISVVYNGLVLWHYFIDGRIWRIQSMPELKTLTVGRKRELA